MACSPFAVPKCETSKTTKVKIAEAKGGFFKHLLMVQSKTRIRGRKRLQIGSSQRSTVHNNAVHGTVFMDMSELTLKAMARK